MKLLLGTNNKGKAIEISEALSEINVSVLTPEQVAINEQPEETGESYEENALLKAEFFHQKSGLPTVADDSGIVIDAIQDELGVHTRRWGAGAEATDEQWIRFFLNRMSNEENKRASFVCAMAYIDPEGAKHIFEGRCDGVITEDLEAEYLPGLPISACFRPDGYDKVFSALSLEEKNTVSHRGRASNLLKEHLRKSW